MGLHGTGASAEERRTGEIKKDGHGQKGTVEVKKNGGRGTPTLKEKKVTIEPGGSVTAYLP